jgi:hypothetical protein
MKSLNSSTSVEVTDVIDMLLRISCRRCGSSLRVVRNVGRAIARGISVACSALTA